MRAPQNGRVGVGVNFLQGRSGRKTMVGAVLFGGKACLQREDDRKYLIEDRGTIWRQRNEGFGLYNPSRYFPKLMPSPTFFFLFWFSFSLLSPMLTFMVGQLLSCYGFIGAETPSVRLSAVFLFGIKVDSTKARICLSYNERK